MVTRVSNASQQCDIGDGQGRREGILAAELRMHKPPPPTSTTGNDRVREQSTSENQRDPRSRIDIARKTNLTPNLTSPQRRLLYSTSWLCSATVKF